jgi:cytochrome c
MIVVGLFSPFAFAAGDVAKGKALDTKSQEMKDIVAYIKSLEKKTSAAKTKAKE